MINFRAFCKYSIKHSIADISTIVSKSKEDGDSHAAVIDKGNIHSTIYLAQECAKNDMKPIIGLEWRDKVSFWAVTHKGLRNLNVISTNISNPAFEEKTWTADDFEDIVALFHPSDHNAFCVPQLAFLQERLGLEVFIEIREDDAEDKKEYIVDFAKKNGLKIIPTSDVLYNERKEALAHDYFHNYIHADGEHLPVDTYYIKTKADFEGWAEAEWIQNAYDLASRIEIDIRLGKFRLPDYDRAPVGVSNFDYLEDLCIKRLNEIELDPRFSIGDYMERLHKELKDVKDAHLESYFLIVMDICDWARENGIKKGRGRGSGAGSLICYLTNITGIDPLRYGLIWERFYNAGREGALPDIDTDFEKKRRGEVIDYIGERWGQDSVMQIITFGSFGPAKAITVVLKIGQCSFEEQKKVAKMVHHKSKNIADALTRSNELADEAKRRKALFTIAQQLEGKYESFGKHAAGVIISDEPFTHGGLPMTWHADDERYVSGYDLYAVEEYGLLKVDVLGLNTLNIIKEAEERIKERHDPNFDINDIPLDDKAVYEAIFHAGETKGVFQLESQLGQRYSELVKPENMEEVADLITLVRPGAMEPGQTQKYLDVRWGQAKEEYPHPKLKGILGSTNSACIYQEQVMFIATDIAGLDLKTADDIRRAAGKKKIKLMEQQKPIFIKGCRDNKVSQAVAEEMWGWILEFSGYGFNKSHALCYAFLSYETAWLKHHYPLEFFEATCNNVVGDLKRSEHEKLREIIYDAKHFGIDILLPSVQRCNPRFEIVDDTKIAYGLELIKGVGTSSIDTINLCKEEKQFTTFLVAALKNKLKKNVLEALICCGALDSYGLTRNTMLAEYQLLNSLTDRELEAVLKEVNGKSITEVIEEMADENEVANRKVQKLVVPNVRRREKIRNILAEYKAKDKYESIIHIATYEREYLGCDISVNETDAVFSNVTHSLADLKKIPAGVKVRVKTAIHLDSIRQTVTKNGKNPGQDMAFITGSDGSAIVDSFVVFPQQFQMFKKLLDPGRVLYIEGETSKTGGIIVNNISVLK
jgi:DNA polymerase-3 subunit alpha